MVDALSTELKLRAHELSSENIETIYFGGGTPSLLTDIQLEQLLQVIESNYRVITKPEITLEANPDDLSEQKLHSIKSCGINRLSIGIQTFDEDRLKLINRAHSQSEAKKCLVNARKAGFDNISADLIYAIPPDDLSYWESDLNTLLSFDLEHLSLYGLTIEERTVFGNWHKKGRISEVSEDTAARQYEMAIKTMKAAGYEHYEVSNFGKPGFDSKHNTGYWENKKYLGIGPGAHSYDGMNRSFNVSNNAQYIRSIKDGKLPSSVESLSETERLNDYLFTHLRTKKGLDCTEVLKKFGVNLPKDYKNLFDQWLDEHLIQLNENRLSLTSKGFMIADEITWRLFYED